MITGLIAFLQQDSTRTGIPDLGVRVSVWFIGMFLLAVGGALLYLRLKELQDARKTGHSGNPPLVP